MQYAMTVLREAVLTAYETYYPELPDSTEVLAVATLLGHLSLLSNNINGLRPGPHQAVPPSVVTSVAQFVNQLYQTLGIGEDEFYLGDLEINDVRMLEPLFLVANLSVCSLQVF